MTTSIGSVTLDYDPYWPDKHKYEDLNMRVYTAVDGSLIISQAARGAHFPITLKGDQNKGLWLKGSTVDALRALSAVPGATYMLTLNGTEFTIYFDNSGGPAVNMTYVKENSTPDSDTWYYGEIKLICTGV